MKWLLIIITMSLALSLVNALPNDAGASINFGVPVNYSLVGVNSSAYWGSYLYSDYNMPSIKSLGYNHTSSVYDIWGKWFYNMSEGISGGNESFNQSLTDKTYVKKTGDTMTGDLNISKASPRLLLINSGDSGYGFLRRITTSEKLELVNLASPILGSVTGGTITTDGDYTVHKFTSNGSFIVPLGVTLNAEVLIVAGGGGGGKGTSVSGGGGGAGGLIHNDSQPLTAGTYVVAVGAGGALDVSGTLSSFNGYTAIGGGRGAGNLLTVGNGGSGGGGTAHSWTNNNPGGIGTAGQGYNGGNSNAQNPNFAAGGGGGGAGEVGTTPIITSSVWADGGDGLAFDILVASSNVYYAGGGGGGAYLTTSGAGGQGGGGAGGISATANTGGGGGGMKSGGTAGAGGSGIVIIRYLTSEVSTSPTETNVIKSESATVVGESSIVTVGDASSRTLIQGSNITFLNNIFAPNLISSGVLNSTYVKKTGDNMTGNLNMTGGATATIYSKRFRTESSGVGIGLLTDNGENGIEFSVLNKPKLIGYTELQLQSYSAASKIIFRPANTEKSFMNATGFYVNQSLEVAGNTTYNGIYGEMWYHNHTGTPLNFAVDGTYYPLFFVNATYLNGFGTQGLGHGSTSSNLTTLVAGMYQVNYMASGDGQNNHEYFTSVFVNEINKDNCESHHKLAAGGDILTQTGTCLLRLAVNDKISLRTADIGSTGTGNYYSANMDLVRIGN